MCFKAPQPLGPSAADLAAEADAQRLRDAAMVDARRLRSEEKTARTARTSAQLAGAYGIRSLISGRKGGQGFGLRSLLGG